MEGRLDVFAAQPVLKDRLVAIQLRLPQQPATPAKKK
jgi:hypothetical protein